VANDGDELSAADFARQCRIHMGAEGFARLLELTRDEDPRNALSALKVLAAYAYGLPAAQVVVDTRIIDPAVVLPESEAAELRDVYRRQIREERQRQLPSLVRTK